MKVRVTLAVCQDMFNNGALETAEIENMVEPFMTWKRKPEKENNSIEVFIKQLETQPDSGLKLESRQVKNMDLPVFNADLP